MKDERNFSARRILPRIPAAILFGAAYWLFLEFIQPEIVNRIYNCSFCERCANILYDKEQLVLAACAGLALFVAAFLKIRGFKGVLKIIAVSYLCFQVYSLLTIWSVVTSRECTALHRPRIFPLVALVFLGVQLLITSGLWASLCAAPLLIFNALLSIVFEREKDFQSLDLE